MGEFFGSMYCWLEEFFGLELADYLWGVSAPAQQTNMFIGIGLTMLIVSLALVVAYYYVLDHPRLNNWWGWLAAFGLNALLSFIVGWQWVLKDYYEGKMTGTDPATGSPVSLAIDESDLLAFGVTDMIDAMIAFAVFSLLTKWWSNNCSHSPF